MAEWLGNGLQNRLQQFDSAWYLKKREVSDDFSFFVVPVHPSHFVTAPEGAYPPSTTFQSGGSVLDIQRISRNFATSSDEDPL